MEPAPPAAPTATREAILHVRAASLAYRLLSGAGVPSLFGYAPGPIGACETVWHGLNSRGELLVAVVDTFDNPLMSAPDLEPINVRLDVVKESPEWVARITACTLHLLGTLEWLPAAVAAGYLAEADVNPLVADAAALPGGRLGIIRTQRVLLHDSAGIAPIPLAEVLAGGASSGSFPSATQELPAREEVGRLSRAELTELFTLADEGWDGALSLTARATTTCSRLHGQVLCVDVDRTGLTLMQVDAAGTRTCLFTFAQPAGDPAQLAARLRDLRTAARDRVQATA